MPSTTRFEPGELVLIAFPFSGSSALKQRPALVILDGGDDDIVVARVTGQLQETAFDVLISAWRGAGLLIRSTVRVHKLATVEKSLVAKRLGRLSEGDRARVWDALRKALRVEAW